jgi:fucose 4-O-acetylase-like acetyltransferase
LLGQLFVRLPHLRPTRYWLFFALPGFLVFTYLTSLQHNSMRAYSIELFYPANSVYLICAFFYLICIWYLFANIRWEKFNFLSSMGRVSLFLYVFHLFILHSTFDWLYLLLKSSMLLSFLTYFLFFCIISAVLNWLKSTANYPKNSLILGVILGK